ncbi:MAG: hypothetical protein ABIE23_02445 [archaeon]
MNKIILLMTVIALMASMIIIVKGGGSDGIALTSVGPKPPTPQMGAEGENGLQPGEGEINLIKDEIFSKPILKLEEVWMRQPKLMLEDDHSKPRALHPEGHIYLKDVAGWNKPLPRDECSL